MTFNKEKIKKFVKKFIIVSVIVFVFLIIVIYLLSISVIPKLEEEQKRREIDRKFPEIKEMEEAANRIEQQEKVWQERYKNDAVGGKTPEETLDLLIEALKKEDVELASRYYVLYNQANKLEKFRRILDEVKNLKGPLEFYLEIKKRGVKKCIELEICSISYEMISEKDELVEIENYPAKIFTPKGTKEEYEVIFKFNSNTQVWKISQP